MGRNVAFEIKGMKELERDLNRVRRKYPGAAEKEVYKQAGQFTKDVNDKFPSSYASENSKATLRKWKRTREKGGAGGRITGVEIANRAPHWHLVENGHAVRISPERAAAVLKGTAFHGQKRQTRGRAAKGRLRTVGFVQGKHYCEKTREEWKDKFPERMREFADRMLKEERL